MIKEQQLLGMLVSLSVKSFKMEDGKPTGPYLSRERYNNMIKDINVLGIIGEHYQEAERNESDALRYALQELDKMKITVNGWDCRILVKKVQDNWNIDLQTIDSDDKATGYIKFLNIRIDDAGNPAAEVHTEWVDTGHKIPPGILNFIENIEQRIRFFQTHLIDNDIRRVIKNMLDAIATIPIRSGVVAVAPRYQELIAKLSEMFDGVGGITFSVYYIANTEENIETLQKDILNTIEEAVTRVHERADAVAHTRKQATIASHISDEEELKRKEREIKKQENIIRDNVISLTHQVVELEDGFPGLFQNPVESLRMEITPAILGNAGEIINKTVEDRRKNNG